MLNTSPHRSWSRVFGLCLRLLAGLVLASPGAAFGQGGKGKGLPGFGQPAGPVTVSVQASDASVAPGGWVVLAVTLDHEEEWHAHTNDPRLPPSWVETGFVAIPTTIEVSGPAGTTVGQIQWPAAHAILLDLTGSGTPEPYEVFEGRAVAFVPVRVAGDAAAGAMELQVEVGYQACDATTCDRPQQESFAVPMTIDPAGPTMPTLSVGDFTGFDPAHLTVAAGTAEPDAAQDGVGEGGTPAAAGGDEAPTAGAGGGRTFFGIPVPGGGIIGLVGLGVLGAIGGLVLNLTPCVLPVIPIKVLTLSKHAGESRARAVMLGLWMAVGVVTFWAALSIPVLTLQGFADPSRIFGIWWLTTGIGVVIAAMSLGLMGMFQITLPQQIYMVNPKADSAWGSFVFGVMTAILGLPCFGFVAGALVPAAITQGTGFVVVLFTSMGVGMAAPYLVLAAFPKLIDRLPKTGPASELVKQIMGLLLLAAAAYFVGSGLIALVASKPYLAKLLHIWAAALCGVVAGGWLVLKTVQITKKPANRALFGVFAVAIAAAGLFVALRFTRDAREEYDIRRAAMVEAAEHGGPLKGVWNDYSPALFRRAQDGGFVVVLDFTAEWCLNCKLLEKAVLGVEPAKSQLHADDVVMIKVDLTGANPEGERALADLDRTGIPTLAVFGPGLSEPWISSAYTSAQVAEAIGRARGDRESTLFDR
jgi:thiol:disulfide interchange protein DsbD